MTRAGSKLASGNNDLGASLLTAFVSNKSRAMRNRIQRARQAVSVNGHALDHGAAKPTGANGGADRKTLSRL